MRTRRSSQDRTGILPFPHVTATAAVAREFPRALSREFPRANKLAEEFVAGIRQPLDHAAAVVRSRRFGFYLDVFGAAVVMALFVAAAILV